MPTPRPATSSSTLIEEQSTQQQTHKAIKLLGYFIRLSLSRGLGICLSLIISVLLASTLGAGAHSDAFFLVRRLVMSARHAFERTTFVLYVPLWMQAVHTMPRAKLKKLLWIQWSKLLLTATTLAIIAIYCADFITNLIAPGFESDRKQLTEQLISILFWMLPVCLGHSLATSVLNANRQYSFSALAQEVPRILLVAALVFMVPPWGVHELAYLLLFGSVVGAIFLITPLRRTLNAPTHTTTDRPKSQKTQTPPNKLTIGSKQFLGIIIAVIYGQGGIWIDMAFASTLSVGMISVLEYGERLTSLLPTLLASSIISIAYTELSDQLISNRSQFTKSLSKTIQIIFMILVPTSTIIAINADLIVEFLLLRGSFEQDTAQTTTQVIWALSPSIVFSSLINLLFSVLFIDKRFNIIGILLTAATVGVLGRALMLYIFTQVFSVGVTAIPVTACAITGITLVLLIRFYATQGLITIDRKQMRTAASITAASIMLALGAWALKTTVLDLQLKAVWLNLCLIGLGTLPILLVYTLLVTLLSQEPYLMDQLKNAKALLLSKKYKPQKVTKK